MEIDFQKQTTPNDVVTVIATQPLTCNETWQRVAQGEWVLFRLGERELRYDRHAALQHQRGAYIHN